MSFFQIASDTQREREMQHVTQRPATTQVINQYQSSRAHQHVSSVYPIATPHPQNIHYSSIHTAQRKQKEESDWWKNKRQQLHHEDIQKQKWIRPMYESEFQIHRPNIQNFSRVLKLRVPDW